MPKSKGILALTLAISLVAVGCSSQWISVALADLPVLVQMALNIAGLVSTLDSGKPLSAHDQTAIENISTKANRDLVLLQSLYNGYKVSPDATVLDEIGVVASDITQNLPAIVNAAQISDPVLAGRVTAGVNLIVTTVLSFVALMPHPPPGAVEAKKAAAARGVKMKPPTAEQLKREWNLQVAPQFAETK
jgi:hypothetical protein